MKIFSFFSFILFFNCLFSQKTASEKYDAQAWVKYDRALSEIENVNYSLAITLLNEALEIEPFFLDAKIAKARIEFKKRRYEKCIEIYRSILDSNPNLCLDCYYEYAVSLAGLGDFEKALEKINIYLSQPNLHEDVKKNGLNFKKNFEFGIEYKKKNNTFISNYKFTPQNLGSSINSMYSEYFPTLTFDAKKIIFTRRVNHRNEDFFESTLEDDSSWTFANRLAGNVNTPLNEGTQSVSLDEKWLAFTGCNFPDGNGSCDIYFSSKTENGWEKPYNIGNKINSEFWESQPSFSPDKRVLYFAAKLPDGFGGSDIYYSTIDNNGEWSLPQNLGPKINTAGDETSPFIHSDNETLYFTSNGWQGYGEMDIFMSQREANGQWQAPKNLGYPINTIENESCLFITSDGKEAYYSSDRSDTKGGLDLYKFLLREDIRPKETFWIKLTLENKNGRNKIPASINILDMDYNAITIRPLILGDSTYLFSLVAGKKYFISAQQKGFMYNYNIEYKKINDTPLVRKRTIKMETLTPNSSFTLKNIYFDFNEYILKSTSIPELYTLLQFLKVNDHVSIRIDGHTDNTGDEKHNMELSVKRAEAVYNFLVNKGIPQNKLEFQGFGFTKPIASNNTEYGKKLNRRTEIHITNIEKE